MKNKIYSIYEFIESVELGFYALLVIELLISILFFVISVLLFPSNVKADYIPDTGSSPIIDIDNYNYSLSYSATTDNPKNTSYYWFYICQLRSDYQLFLYHSGTTDYEGVGYRYYQVGYVDSDGVCKKFDNYSQPVVCESYVENTYDKSDGKLFRSDIYGINEASVGKVNYFQVYYESDYLTDGYVFEDLESAQDYFDNGNKDGMIKDKDPDFDYEHDFGKDEYNADIPVPQLKNLSHNGFTVVNASDDLYLDVIVESRLYGIKHINTINSVIEGDETYSYSYDPSWVYSSHYYNIADLSQIAVNSSDIDLYSLWKCNNQFDLIQDFKKWSSEYPKHTSLPDYSFWKHFNEEYYFSFLQRHVYNSSSQRTDLQQLTGSGQAETTYYVRFYDKDINCSKWMSYKYRDGGGTLYYPKDDQVEVGVVEPDKDGKPTVPDSKPGVQDPVSGDVTYDWGTGESTFDASDLWATIQSLVNGIGVIPDIIGEVLSFLPSWLLAMIAVGIASIVVLRFVGR